MKGTISFAGVVAGSWWPACIVARKAEGGRFGHRFVALKLQALNGCFRAMMPCPLISLADGDFVCSSWRSASRPTAKCCHII